MMNRKRISWVAVAVAVALLALLVLLWGGRAEAQTRPFVGAHANAWNAAAVAINGTSAPIDTQWAPHCSVFGSTSAAATVTVQLSQNGTNYYASNANTGAVTGDFGIYVTPGARYVRLVSNAAATITATVACKIASR